MFGKAIAHLAAPALLIALSVLYLSTLSTTVQTADSAEFQVVAATLGVAHPPGFPLYTMLGALFAHLPFLTPATARLTLLSTVCAILTVLVVYETGMRLHQRRAAAVLGAAALATATTFWAQATTANVRSLTALFTALIFWALIALHQCDAGERRRYTIILMLALGFGVAHHLSLAFIAVVVVLWLLRYQRRALRLLPLTALGLLPLLYLLVQQPALRRPAPFVRYILGLGFGGDFFAFRTPAALWQRTLAMGQVLTFQWHWLVLLAALLGWLLLWRKQRAVALLLGGAFLVHAAISATYRAPQTVEYMLPAYIPLALALGGVDRGSGRRRLPLLLPLLLLIGWQTLQRWPSYEALAATGRAVTYSDTVFEQAPEGALILSNWHWYNTLRYRQQIDGVRDDLDIVYIAPGSLPYAQSWTQAIAAAITDGRDVIATNRYVDYAALPPSVPLGDLFWWPAKPLQRLPADFIERPLRLANDRSTLEIVGYRSNRQHAPLGEELVVTLAWKTQSTEPLKLFAHLVDSSGTIVALDDQTLRPQSDGLSLAQMRLTPAIDAVVGQAQLLIGARRLDDAPLLDDAGQPRSELLPLALLRRLWPIDDGLVGFGHGLAWRPSTSLPPLQPGQTVDLTQQLAAWRPVEHDIVVSVSLIGLEEDGKTWAWRVSNDSVPATGAIPTLKWIAGSRVADSHRLTVPADALPGQQVEARLTFYDAWTGRTLPVLAAARVQHQGGGLLLGRSQITPP